MAEPWFWSENGKLYFLYRARDWSTNPPSDLDDTKILSVAATAFKADGTSVTVAQQPIWVPNLKAYVGHINGSDILNVTFVSVRLVPTLAVGVPAGWCQEKRLDIVIEIPGGVGAYLTT